MKINSHLLPKELVNAIQSKSLYREFGSWQLKSNQDSFGNQLETELSQVFETEEEILEATKRLSIDFKVDGYYGEESVSEYPGGIPDIVDFTDIVCFGCSGDDSPFCLDYRLSKDEPSIIWWDDIYWRKISQNFREFLRLFELDY